MTISYYFEPHQKELQSTDYKLKKSYSYYFSLYIVVMYVVSISSVANYCMLSSCVLFITVNNLSANGGQTENCCLLPGVGLLKW